jgi:hypothetical protein
MHKATVLIVKCCAVKLKGGQVRLVLLLGVHCPHVGQSLFYIPSHFKIESSPP